MRQWLRAAILGSNDGLVSISALMLGVAATHIGNLITITTAGIVAGAMSMGVGEYVSVRAEGSRKDSIQAAIASSLSYAVGGLIPLLGTLLPSKNLSIVAVTLLGLFIAGILSGRDLDNKSHHIARVVLGGFLGMIITAGVGFLIR